MNQSLFIKLVDLLSFITLTLMVSTGIVIEFTLPTRSGGSSVWGLTRHEWGDIHFYISIAFLFLMTAHLISHLKFLKSVFCGKAPAAANYRIAIGIFSVVALIILALAPAASPVTETKSGHQFQKQSR